MTRSFLSRPVQQLLLDGLMDDGASLFDYGCGKGGDVRRLHELGHEAAGWDPAHAADEPKRRAQVVNLGYVINVIENVDERKEALQSAWQLTDEVLVVSGRLEWEVNGAPGKPFHDGWITNSGSFQKFYSQEELRSWIDRTLGEQSVAAAPGIFYVFRSEAAEQRLLARHARGETRNRLGIAELIYRRHHDLLDALAIWIDQNRKVPNAGEIDRSQEFVDSFGSIRAAFAVLRRVTESARWIGIDTGSRRTSESVFEANLELLQPLIDFLTERGRLPHDTELEQLSLIEKKFGSARKAYSLIRRVTGSERWKDFEARSRRDFLVYLALSAFGGRPRFSELPPDLQHDARDLFGNYKEAIAQSDKLLFAVGNQEAVDVACRSATFGKLTPEALYVHVEGLSQAPAILRIYTGCAETLTGRVNDTTILKMHRLKPQVSFLVYPDFDRVPHPKLQASIVSRIREQAVSYKDFTNRENPPILHRKESFVPQNYPGREKFERLTIQEEKVGLLNDPSIGTVTGWNSVLEETGYELRGHRLIRGSSQAAR
jgi:hypothetical protein